MFPYYTQLSCIHRTGYVDESASHEAKSLSDGDEWVYGVSESVSNEAKSMSDVDESISDVTGKTESVADAI